MTIPYGHAPAVGRVDAQLSHLLRHPSACHARLELRFFWQGSNFVDCAFNGTQQVPIFVLRSGARRTGDADGKPYLVLYF